jgi:hypothetical protein
MRRYIVGVAAAGLIGLTGPAWGQALDQVLKAADAGDAKTVATFLDKGLDPNSTDKQGNTLLMIAAVQGHEALVKLLIERKADVARRSPAGDSALMLASLKGHLAVVKLLVEHHAPISYKTGWAPLHYAAFEGKTEVVKYLLEKGADRDAIAPNGYSALLLAMRNGHMEAARELLYADADVNIKGARGETALSLALGRKDKELEELIRRAGAVE